MSHFCKRNTHCSCQSFITSNLSVLLSDNDQSVLTSEVLRESINTYCLNPEVHLPFATFLHWMQTELYLSHYSDCEKYIKIYLSHCKLNGGEFEITKENYQELMEVLVFHCIYIYRGYEESKECIMKDKVMDHIIKAAFLKRLNEVDGRPMELIKENDTNKTKEVFKMLLLKHKWKLISILACLALITIVKSRLINKVKYTIILSTN